MRHLYPIGHQTNCAQPVLEKNGEIFPERFIRRSENNPPSLIIIAFGINGHVAKFRTLKT